MASRHHKVQTIDALGKRPGRLATQIATFLMGKHKAIYEPHVDRGDKVVVLNADKVVFTGKKLVQKEYKHHSMHPGGLKTVPVKKVLKENPVEVIQHAVSKMLPRNSFRTARLRRLSFK